MRSLDARGLRCPWPALRAARALREGGAVEILADDPAAARELAALAAVQGLEFLVIDTDRYRIGAGGS
ncbi:sulfurtransferase TusA family protein [Sphingomonas sp. IW22]|jgi:tRNA 2-thiouridine synthesizing protein A|uniref:sulfurtransferase TusA family protein n=1 Tax=Sphingomonas sp. IW22 TaxID=3242489 RepID=UPI003520B19A